MPENEFKIELRVDSFSIFIVAFLATILLLLTSPSCDKFVTATTVRDDQPIQQSQECFGPLQKFVDEEELVCR